MNFYRIRGLALLCLVFATTPVEGESPGAPVTPQTAIVTRLTKAHDARNLDAALGAFGPEASLFDLSTGDVLAQGTKAIRKRYEKQFSNGPDLRTTVRQRIALDNYVIDRESIVTKTGAAPTESITIYFIRDNLIQAAWYLFVEKTDPVREKRNGDIIERLFDVTNTRDVGRILDHFTLDVAVRTLPSNGIELEGRDELSDRYERSFSNDAALQVAISEKILGGDYVVVHEQIESSTGPQFEDLMIYDIKNGKVKRAWSLLSD